MTGLWTAILIFLLSVIGLLPADGPTSDIPTPQPSAQGVVARVIRVIDGDTILVRVDDTEERVRYIGIDTPEIAHSAGEEAECYGEEAKARNEVLLAAGEVILWADAEDRDTYGRLLRYVYVGDVFVNQSLIEEGYAEAIAIKPNVSWYATFRQSEKNARDEKRGLWSSCAGS